VFLCAGTETPPNHRIKKASINTTEWVDWEYCESAIEAIRKLKSSISAKATTDKQIPNIQIVAIEQNEKSVPYDKVDYQFPVALIIGHETDGVSREALEASDVIAEMPMWGVNISLNVMVSLGIVLYQVMESRKITA
jgi:23S rRNA (guanosine2251-2'-O)-methyltransferase